MSKIVHFFQANDPSRTINAKRAYDDLVWKSEQLDPNVHIEQGKGYIYEFLENAKHNIDRGSHGLRYENILTGLPKERGGYGEIHAIDDIRINGKSYQLKVHNDIDDYFADFYDSKYKNCGFVVPSDQYRDIHEELFSRYEKGYISKSKYLNLSNRIHKGQTSLKELYKFCDEKGYVDADIAQKEAIRSINRAFLQDCKSMIETTTFSSAITNGVISSIKNVNKFYKGEIKVEKCFKNILHDTAKGAKRGFFVGSLANVFNYLGHSFSSGNILQSGAVSLTLANGIFDLGASYKEYISGNIDGANFCEQIVTKSVISVATLISRVVFINNPIIGTITSIVTNIITNELLKGSKKYAYENDASLFNNELLKSIETENTKALNELKRIISKQEKNYFEVKLFINKLSNTVETEDVLKSLIQISEKLNLNVNFDTYNEFKLSMINKENMEI